MTARVERSTTRLRGFQDAEMDFQLIRQLGVAPYGGAALGECLSAARDIEDGNPWSWADAFGKLAVRIEEAGRACLDKGHKVSARELLLRASSYYRSAEYYGNPRTPQHRDWGLKSRDCFILAAPLCRERIEVVAIPFEDTTLPGYFLKPDGSKTANKTILIMTGFDGSGEELYFQSAAAAVERGFNALIFEGPGQTGTLRLHPELTFRPDYEVVVRAVVDFALARADVDPERLGLYGISFGGYFTIRAACHEPRLRALIPNSPILDLHRYMVGWLGFDSVKPEEDITADELAEIPEEMVGPNDRWGLYNVTRRFGVQRVSEWLEFLKQFRVGDEIKKIMCPTLALVGEGEGDNARAQAKEFFEGIGGPGTLYEFTVAQGADTHCQLNNLNLSNQVIYDWLDELWRNF